MRVHIAGLEHNAGEVGAVGAVGEVLCFETEGAAAAEGGAVLSFVAVGPVVAVELHAGLGGVYFHCAAADGFGYFGCEGEFAGFLLVEYEAVVVTGAVFDLFVVGINAFAHGVGVVKSNGVPFTLRISPVGMEFSSIGM